ncbi:MAG: DUF1659 domain-containing protein [Peptostreptococcaceae bacterium]|nr:DUF1659 domain-containing protein [Peptostreptococcaceae bacterium]
MATTTPKSLVLRLTYDFGLSGDKKVIKSKTINGLRIDVGDEKLLDLANAIFALQTKSGTITKVENSTITA